MNLVLYIHSAIPPESTSKVLRVFWFLRLWFIVVGFGPDGFGSRVVGLGIRGFEHRV